MAKAKPTPASAIELTEAEGAQDLSKTPAYVVSSPLNHNGLSYSEGAAIELTEAEAAPLLVVGTICLAQDITTDDL